ncbi:hypothetical protein S-PM2d081 [Synechococcus phage S-PM2]|uniref:Hypothetical-Protein / belonging to T4-LIKE GC: 826 n=1 Tax=Synechococcus phage S-PM2 TaxID=238854 RepID=Q5GQT9_BPSYP|nr:virion structural protein [Synechococcus phage S-PM2]CAF34145.1 Hypothetical-Protein / belonging to T4-LIKE GC: 826 [Synechococcus phage S-PM2]CFW42211.1 hypothetical protein S-PM2d081 [Synechococcus phage S-PM2]
MAETRRISTLIETQLPEFISSDYENFSKVVEKYYEQLELRGQPLDVIQNITKYRDIDFYEKNLLQEKTVLAANASPTDTTIIVEDATSFPEENGYIRIGEEILFYKERTDTTFLEVSRGVSGNTKLGDLYEKSNFVTTLASEHYTGDNVQNISNLFLYAIVKNFESDYLASFPEKYLKNAVDKRTLIKNISDFYRAKGTDQSIKFIFNTLISTDKPSVVNPKDFTFKASNSDWISSYSLKVKLISGDINDIIGKEIIQNLDPLNSAIKYASAVVDNVFAAGVVDGEQLYQISLDTSTINNTFNIAAKTSLSENFTPGMGEGDRVNVFSTQGFPAQGRFIIRNEEFLYTEKNINQFVIESRTGNQVYTKGDDVYSYSSVECDGVKLLILGVLYNLNPSIAAPYSEEGDNIQISDSGFTTRDPIIIDIETNQSRWIFSESKASSLNQNIDSQISNLKADVSAIFEDENYYYICSSGYPGRQILNVETQGTLSDQKILRLIRKNPQTITETYQTSQRDVGILVDGTLAFSHRDFDQVKFGPINKFTITDRGNGYLNAPYVLVDNIPGKARVFLSGETIGTIESLDSTAYTEVPRITITSGRGARAEAIVTFGRITSLQIIDAGEYYSTPPQIIITDRLGRGRFAEYTAILEDGKIVGFNKIDEGKFYTKGSVNVTIVPVGSGATASCDIVTWTKDRYKNLESELDSSNGYIFQNFNPVDGYGYGVCANPVDLRVSLNDDGLSHSPILGYAYDGNPIYGPYGFINPLDSSSAVAKISSGYRLNSSRIGGPSTQEYPIGTFIEDYEWTPSIQTGKLELDENNGRFCVTPEYPEGTYAYFVTIDNTGIPAFPYILGKNYYSLPVDSNYNSDISQNDIPKIAKRFRTIDIEKNGDASILKINKTLSGNVSSISVLDSPDTFRVGNKFIVSNDGSEGSGASAFVSEVTGKEVVSLNSKSLDERNLYGVALIKLVSSAFLFENDIITQENSNFTGRVISNVLDSNVFVIDQVEGTYVEGEKLNSSSNIVSILIDRNSFYTANSIISLTDGEDSTLATGRILQAVSNQNSVRVEVLTGEFLVPEDTRVNYFLQSSTVGDTVGSEVITYRLLSKNLESFSYDENIALVETNGNHNVGVDNEVNIDIIPDKTETTTTYYVRKRFYQEITLRRPSFSSSLIDSGVGRVDFLNGGAGYQSGEYLDVELIFFDQSKVRNGIGAPGDQNNARATIFVSDFNDTGFGSVSVVTITNKGSGYIKGDRLTLSDVSLSRNPNEISTQRLAMDVDHVGFAKENTELFLRQINKLSENDFLKINNEIVKVVSIDSTNRVVNVLRAQEGSTPVDHFDGARVTLYNGVYRFDENARPLGTGVNDPYIIDYNPETQLVKLAYDYNSTNPREITNSSIFQDNSSPRKSIAISSTQSGINKLEFSKDETFATYATNADIRIQKYYRYLFDTSHFSMNGIFLDFSASKSGNIFTEEKEISGIQPGNVGSYVAITLGFGPNIVGADQKKFPVNFDTYYYFIKASDNVDTGSAALRVIDDPLAGKKNIVFSTPTKFAYRFTETPEYNGIGTITYTTTSPFAEGKIHAGVIDNLGANYKRLPIVKGCFVNESNEAILDTEFDSITGKIVSITILNTGKNYLNPKAIVSNGDGSGAEFKVYSDNGIIKRVEILNPGSGFTYKPTVSVYESDVKAYFNSVNIGIPQDVTIINNGGSFHTDRSLLSTYRSNYALLTKGDTFFYKGERLQQVSGNNLVFSGIVSQNGWRVGSNILRLEQVQGVIDTNLPLVAINGNGFRFVEVTDVLYTEFSPDIRSYFDNLGRYSSDRGKVGARSQRIIDSYFYQDYSYVIQSRTPIDVWRDLIKQTTHPAGFQLFGEVLIDSEQKAEMPTSQRPTSSVSYIELPKQTITIETTTTRVTNSFIALSNTKIVRGTGSISIDEYDTEGILSRTLVINEEFTGRYAKNIDYVGDVKPLFISEFGNPEITSASGISISGTNGRYTLYSVKPISNSLNIPPNQLYTQSYQSVIQPGDLVINKGLGSFSTNNFVGFVWDYPTASGSTKVFGVFNDGENVFNDFKVGDTFTYFASGNTYFKFEISEVNAPAYDPIEGVIGNGNILGRRTFTLFDSITNLPYNPYNEQELFITINGVAQEPGVSYKVSGSNITFSEAPLGKLNPVTGQNLDDTYETDPVKFVCKTFKFKEDTYNQRYLRKLKDISPNFNGVSSEFDLYWEDGSIVKADPNEKFLIFINGVLQRSKEDPENPLGNAYYINRRPSPSEPDQIVFSEPPRNFFDDIDTIPKQLDQRESFFGYGVGSYERLTIDNRLIPYRGQGPYLLFGEVDNRVRSITSPEFCLVFVDGVLQSPDTYILNGPNITFSGLLQKYIPETGSPIFNRVDIISLYGRDVPKTLSIFDYDRYVFTNLLTLNVNRVIDSDDSRNDYLEWKQAFDYLREKPLFIHSTDAFGKKALLGKIENVTIKQFEDGSTIGSINSNTPATSLAINLTNPININFEFLSFNPLEDDETIKDRPIDLYITKDPSGLDILSSLNSTNPSYSIELSYSVDEDGNRIMVRDIAYWLLGSKSQDDAYQNIYNSLADILPGDKIQIDGEKSYREVFTIPSNVRSRNFVEGDLSKYEHYAKIEASNYNDITRGEGLSITTRVTDGKVTSVGFSDLEWNKRDLKLFFDTGILLQPTAYQYFVPPQVKFIPVDGKGGGARAEILAVAGQILDVVLLDGGSGYTQPPKAIITRGYNVLRDNRRVINSTSIIGVSPSVKASISNIQSEIVLGGEGTLASVFSIIAVGGDAGDELDTDREVVSIVNLLSKNNNISQKETLVTTTGRLSRTLIDAGLTTEPAIEIETIISTPLAVIPSVEIAEFKTDNITTSIHKQVNTPVTYIAENSYSVTGAFLDSPLSPSSQVVYVKNTSLFPDSGKLQIGKEIVTYEGKLSDRFLNVVRGVDGTESTAHPGGQYIRTFVDSVIVIPVGPKTIITTEINLTSIQNIEVLEIFSSIGGGLSSIYNVTIDLPLVNQQKKESDVTLFRETGVVDYYTEVAVLLPFIQLRS